MFIDGTLYFEEHLSEQKLEEKSASFYDWTADLN